MTSFIEAGEPPPTAEPCNECPWRRVALRGWLGPHSAADWSRTAHTDIPVACHKTIRHNQSWEGASQCRGMAIFRANVGKRPRNPAIASGPTDTDRVFASDAEFIDHHEGSA